MQPLITGTVKMHFHCFHSAANEPVSPRQAMRSKAINKQITRTLKKDCFNLAKKGIALGPTILATPFHHELIGKLVMQR